MSPRIPRLNIPRPVIDRIPPPVTNDTPPPVVNAIQVPVIDVPTPIIEYPTLDAPTREQFEGSITPQEEPTVVEEVPTRLLPDSVPILGRDIPIPDAATLITTGSTAAVAVATTMASTLLLRNVINQLDPLLKKLLSNSKKKKNKKKGKVVLHIMKSDDKYTIFEYSNNGTSVVDVVDNIENYLRDKINEDTFYEIDNKIIIDDKIKPDMTKEGQKRFGKLFCPAKSIAKKLSAKLSF